ncbi:MAG: hypothetical protein GZ087_12575 [Flavobacterium sp.]|nr:hypothetical protein [Flavobacterium sp.]
MKREEFKNWLVKNYKDGKGMALHAAESRVSNAQKVEDAFGDFDKHYEVDKLASVVAQLAYPVRETRPLPRGIVIDGDYVTGMATLRQGVRRYIDFKKSE